MFGIKKLIKLCQSNYELQKHNEQRLIIIKSVEAKLDYLSHEVSEMKEALKDKCSAKESRENFVIDNINRLNHMILELKGEMAFRIGEIKSFPLGSSKNKGGRPKKVKKETVLKEGK